MTTSEVAVRGEPQFDAAEIGALGANTSVLRAAIRRDNLVARALDRLRAGDGVRTVLVVDPELAGRAPGRAPSSPGS